LVIKALFLPRRGFILRVREASFLRAYPCLFNNPDETVTTTRSINVCTVLGGGTVVQGGWVHTYHGGREAYREGYPPTHHGREAYTQQDSFLSPKELRLIPSRIPLLSPKELRIERASCSFLSQRMVIERASYLSHLGYTHLCTLLTPRVYPPVYTSHPGYTPPRIYLSPRLYTT